MTADRQCAFGDAVCSCLPSGECTVEIPYDQDSSIPTGEGLGYIYVLCDPRLDPIDDDRYVGFTVDPKRRLARHISGAAVDRTHCAAWIRQLLREGLKPSLVILERTPDDWAEAEKRWIRAYREAGARLTNIADGGQGAPGNTATRGRTLTEEHKGRIREGLMRPEVHVKLGANKGKSPSLETRAKQSASTKGRPLAQPHAEAVRIAAARRKGTKVTGQALLNMRAAFARDRVERAANGMKGLAVAHATKKACPHCGRVLQVGAPFAQHERKCRNSV